VSEPSPDNEEQVEQAVIDAAAPPPDLVSDSVSDSVSISTSEQDSEIPESKPESKSDSKPESKPDLKPASALPQMAPAKHGNLLVLGLMAVAGALVVTVVTCDIFDQKLPDFLQPFEPALEKHIRYGLGYGTGSKDWRNELLIEQAIWSSEVNKIRLGQNNAKPEMYKRDYLFYLADSYYRDEPHFLEAKAAYLAGRAEPVVPHKPGYDIEPSELACKIGYSAMRCGSYAEAEKYLKEAIATSDADKEPNRKMVNGGRAQFLS
jgi:hypothetical protein